MEVSIDAIANTTNATPNASSASWNTSEAVAAIAHWDPSVAVTSCCGELGGLAHGQVGEVP